jgi:hypothetical protein
MADTNKAKEQYEVLTNFKHNKIIYSEKAIVTKDDGFSDKEIASLLKEDLLKVYEGEKKETTE